MVKTIIVIKRENSLKLWRRRRSQGTVGESASVGADIVVVP